MNRLNRAIEKEGPLANCCFENKLYSLTDVIDHVRQLPYGRNENRNDFSLVLKEGRGTCSSKHALIKALAEEQNWEEVNLILCIYRMNRKNTPGIGDQLDGILDYIPEAHCFLRIGSEEFDITFPDSDIQTLQPDILATQAISANQISSYKVEYHKNWLKQWLADSEIPLSFEALWKIREICIAKLTKNKVKNVK